jgi:hypothetical protein
MPISVRPSSTPTYPIAGAASCISRRTPTPGERTAVNSDPNLMIPMLTASAVAWLMLRAGLAKKALEPKRKPRTCPSCGRVDDCACV